MISCKQCGADLGFTRPFVICESPYRAVKRAEAIRNHNYAKAILVHSLKLGESPFLSHLFYTQFLSDHLEELRKEGMEAGWALYVRVDKVAVYSDLGFSEGMVRGIERAARLGVEVEYRKIGWPLGEK